MLREKLLCYIMLLFYWSFNPHHKFKKWAKNNAFLLAIKTFHQMNKLDGIYKKTSNIIIHSHICIVYESFCCHQHTRCKKTTVNFPKSLISCNRCFVLNEKLRRTKGQWHNPLQCEWWTFALHLHNVVGTCILVLHTWVHMYKVVYVCMYKCSHWVEVREEDGNFILFTLSTLSGLVLVWLRSKLTAKRFHSTTIL